MLATSRQLAQALPDGASDPLTPAEVEKLAQAVNHESDRVLVRLMAFGGLRINECFALQWSDVDLDRDDTYRASER
jgi:integrase